MTDREPRDVVRVLMDWLATDLAAQFPTLTVALALPSNWMPQSPPALVLEDDGDPLRMWPVATSPTIRVTSWTKGRTREYVNRALVRLLTARIPGIAAIKPSTGFIDDRDPKTGGDLSSFTVSARARLAVPQQ